MGRPGRPAGTAAAGGTVKGMSPAVRHFCLLRAGLAKRAWQNGSARPSACQKKSRLSSPQRRKKLKSFSAGACTWQKIHLRLRSVGIVRLQRTIPARSRLQTSVGNPRRGFSTVCGPGRMVLPGPKLILRWLGLSSVGGRNGASEAVSSARQAAPPSALAGGFSG